MKPRSAQTVARMLLAAAALSIVAGCSTDASRGSSTPSGAVDSAGRPLPTGPAAYFPPQDVPIVGTTSVQQQYWAPYEVATVPGVHTLDTMPQPPRVINDTGGVVPDTLAQGWARGYYRAATWRRWAIIHAQANFLRHLGDDPAGVGSELSSGSTAAVPDCGLFPASMTLIQLHPGGQPRRTSQYGFVLAFTIPCPITVTRADGKVDDSRSLIESGSYLARGWPQTDPLLGELWLSEHLDRCDSEVCPAVPAAPPPPVGSAPAPPDQDVPVDKAAPTLAAAWEPYEVTVVPGRTALAKIPDPPSVDNRTGGAVPPALAQRWALALFREQAWWRWSWQAGQLNFQTHVANDSRFGGDLADLAQRGGRPTIPNCAVFPTQLILSQIDNQQRENSGPGVGISQYAFTLGFQTPCALVGHLPDGSTTSLAMKDHVILFGTLRADPLLGDLWFPVGSEVPETAGPLQPTPEPTSGG